MTHHVDNTLAFRDAEAVLWRWQGRGVRVVFSHRSSLHDIAAVPESILQRIDPMPEEITGPPGDGLWLTFGDADGAVTFTLLVHEQHFDHAIEFDRELQIWLDDLEVIIAEAPAVI